MANLYEGYTAQDIFNALEAKPLNTKKNIFDFNNLQVYIYAVY